MKFSEFYRNMFDETLTEEEVQWVEENPEEFWEAFLEDEDTDSLAIFEDEDAEEAEELDEALKRKVVVRNGKRVKKKISSKTGYKVATDSKTGKKKEVKMSPAEQRTRKKAAKKAARKAKPKKAQAARKRAKSMKKVRK